MATAFKLNSLSAVIAASLLVTNTAVLADDESNRKSMDTIVVTGEKTEKSLKETMSSVAVVDTSLIENGQLASISEALSEMANVVVLTGAVPDMRGVSGNGGATGFNSFSGGSKARVSTLIDGVSQPFVADLTGDTGLWDMEQIEVYRGPQSTSNGRNSIAGAVYMKTKAPTQEFEGAVRVGYRNQDNYFDTAAVISGALVEDVLAFRLSTQYIDGETFSNPPVYDTNPTDRELNKLDTSSTRAKLLYTPFEDLSVQLTYSTYNEEGNAGRKYFEAAEPTDYIPLFQRILDTESDTTQVNVDYKINENFSLDVLVAYMDYKWAFDAYEPQQSAESDVSMDESNVTLDTKLNFGLNSDFYSGFVGLAYFDRDQDFESVGATYYFGDDSSKSTAIYGESSFNLNSQLTLTAGLRIEREEQVRNFNMAFRGDMLVEQLDDSHTLRLPKLALQYKITEETTLFASARRGYNAGGGALDFTAEDYYYYDEETVNTYEIGSRSVLNNGDLNISANVFYNNFNGYQALSAARRITNIEDAHSYGLELEAYSMLGDQWQLHGGLGLLKTKIDESSAFPEAVDNDLNSAPELTASLGLSHWFTDSLKVNLSANYVDEFYGDLTNTEERVAGDYTLTRLTITYDTEQWLISAFINNAFDEQEYTAREPASGRYPQGYVGVVNPQTLGASVTYRF
ncbi:TonB-dependent receptor [Pseudoalteromonas sp. CO302Y]|uniref:TonB-dependent receptor n=1 Tax=unclassified Pseudoalteromonas TaxID=194690 RepID=UPI001023A6EA|nr:TonB-dependent receptor [Pseudoalteromonas sp. CO302Y]RZG06527.1 TonB-dependent receptor [Pseudoalteromonas sp. CO133X]